ncbi:hypothetical protein GCM10010530_20180 [Kribbella aluminosa]
MGLPVPRLPRYTRCPVSATRSRRSPSIPESDHDSPDNGAREGDFFSAIFTPYWDGAGNPVLSLPTGVAENGLPRSLQIAGRPFEEALVLRAGDAFSRPPTGTSGCPTVGS